MKFDKKFVLAALLSTSKFVQADQPVHCLRDQLFGMWTIHVTQDSKITNLFQTQEVCTHNIPNRIQLINKDYKFQFLKEDVYRINLLENYKAEAVFCKNGNQCESKKINGTWNAIYDQALNIELENGLRFLSNLRYNLKPTLSKDPYVDAQKTGVKGFGQIETSDYAKFDSECKQTMVGFTLNLPDVTGKSYSMHQHNVQCFYAEQEKHYNYETSQSFNDGPIKYAKVIERHNVTPDPIITPSLAQTNLVQQNVKKVTKRVNMHLEHKPSDEMDLLIEAINEADLGWKADTCKYQKHHAKYGKHCDKVELAQIKDLGDEGNFVQEEEGISGKKEFGVEGDKAFQAVLEKAQQWQKKTKKSSEIPDSEIPESLDWRDFMGYDFTSSFRDQSRCGSCYTISFIQVAEARLRLKYGKNVPLLSPQMMMTCNYMNEGCDGGWPHFNIFMAENGHLVSEECAPYLSRTKGDKCSNYSQCAPIAKVQKSFFVGGGWGNTSEKAMMKEILRSGPINGDFQAPSAFSIYKEGIFSEKGLISIHEKTQKSLQSLVESNMDTTLLQLSDSNFSAKTLNDRQISFMEMNHSVVIVGWGKDEKTGVPYWIVRNSYGQGWGMNGDFLVRRGNNEFGMEVEQLAFEPTLCASGSTDSCTLI